MLVRVGGVMRIPVIFVVSVVVYRELGVKQLYEVLIGAAQTTSVIMFLVASAMVSRL